jgi:hypothetical protein
VAPCSPCSTWRIGPDCSSLWWQERLLYILAPRPAARKLGTVTTSEKETMQPSKPAWSCLGTWPPSPTASARDFTTCVQTGDLLIGSQRTRTWRCLLGARTLILFVATRSPTRSSQWA